jgi:hypothetical protein
MKKYFLHNGTEPSGPFDFQELKAIGITNKSPVWFEGMDNWKYAGEVAELSSLFAIVPPPIITFEAVPPTLPKEKKSKSRKILGISKNNFWIGLGVMLLLTFLCFFNNMQEERTRELKQKNYKTEVENRKYELQQKEIEQQKIMVAEAEKAAAERMNKEKEQTLSARILEIQKTIDDYQINIEVLEKKLEKAAGFKVLRTAAEKNEQMNLLQNEINKSKSEIELLQKESDQLKMELEKMK